MLKLYEKIGTCNVLSTANTNIPCEVFTCNALIAICDKADNNLIIFFDDLQHLKRCLGLSKNYKGEKTNTLINFINDIKLLDTKTFYGNTTKTIVNTFNKANICAKLVKNNKIHVKNLDVKNYIIVENSFINNTNNIDDNHVKVINLNNYFKSENDYNIIMKRGYTCLHDIKRNITTVIIDSFDNESDANARAERINNKRDNSFYMYENTI